MTLNIKATNSAIYAKSTVSTTSGAIFYGHSTRKQHAYLSYSERTPRCFVLYCCWRYPSIQTAINPWFACPALKHIALGSGREASYRTCLSVMLYELLYPTPCAIALAPVLELIHIILYII